MMDSTLPSQSSLHLLIYAFSKSRAVYNTVHELTAHLHKEKKKEKNMFLKSQLGLVVQFHQQYSTNTKRFMSVKCTKEF